MRKDYIMPQTQAQIITVGQLMLPSSGEPTIQKGESVPVVPGGMYV